jgi:hypothetical protein
LEQGDAILVETLQRNVYAGEKNLQAKKLADWMVAAKAKLRSQTTKDILQAQVMFT